MGDVTQKNVFGEALEECGCDPMTGWYRDGYCQTDQHDHGVHTVCAQVTDAFLEYSASRGNELRRPMPGFPGLRAGDTWCLCASRWLEAKEAGVAPNVKLKSTHLKTLQTIELAVLSEYAVD